MNGGTQGELLRLNNGHPRRTNIAEKNYKAKTYYISTQNKIKSKIRVQDYSNWIIFPQKPSFCGSNNFVEIAAIGC